MMKCLRLLLFPVGGVNALHYGRQADGVYREDGIIISRKIDFLEPGGEDNIVIDEPRCNFTQVIGETDVCVVPWRQNMTMSGNVSVPGGYDPSDVIQMEYKLEGSGDDADLKRVFSAGPWDGILECGVCETGCSFKAKAGYGFNMHSLLPNPSGPPDVCRKKLESRSKRIVIAPHLMSMPTDPFTGLGLRATATLSWHVLKSDRQPRFEQEYTVKVVPPPPTSAEPVPVSSNPWATSMASQGRNLYRMYQALSSSSLLGLGNASSGTGLLGVMWEMTKSGIVEFLSSREASAFNLGARQNTQTRWINALAIRGSLLSAESPKIRVMFNVGDEKCDGDKVCKVKVDSPQKVEFRMVIDQEIVPGDTISITSRPAVGGPFGQAIGNYIKLPTMTLPLCGEEDKDYSITIPIIQKSIKYKPFPCGRYATAINSPPYVMSVPDFTDFRLSDLGIPRIPNVPDVVSGMPSMVLAVHFTMKHKDESVIADFIIEGGISQVK